MNKIKKFSQLNESAYTDSTFKTILTHREIDLNKNIIKNYEQHLIDFIDVKNCIIYWDYTLNLDKQGIDSITPIIKFIKINIDITVQPSIDIEDTETFEEELSFNDTNSVFIIKDLHYTNEKEYEVRLLPYNPTELEIEFKDDKFQVTIVF